MDLKIVFVCSSYNSFEAKGIEWKTVCRLNYWDLRCVVRFLLKLYVFETMSNELEEMLETITSCIAYDEEIWIKFYVWLSLQSLLVFSPEAKIVEIHLIDNRWTDDHWKLGRNSNTL